MKNLNEFIIESLHTKYTVQPKNYNELLRIVNSTLKQGKYDLNFIDTSEITDMSMLFAGNKCDFDVSNWDVSKVTNMQDMFVGCVNFTGKGLEKWDVSNLKNMENMFCNCKNFTGKSIKNWNVSKVNNIV